MDARLAKQTLLFTILASSVGVVMVLGLTGFDASTTLSQMAAQQRGALLVLALMFSVTAMLLFVYTQRWLLPELRPPGPLVFYLLPITILIVALVPYTTPLLRHIHDVAAYGMALLAPIYTGLLAFTKVSRRARVVVGVMCLIEIVILGFLFFAPALYQYFFYFQLAHLASLAVALFAVTYDT